MTKGIGTPENRETAYRVYALFGGRNIKQVLGRLQWKHELDISAQTLYEWKKEGRWDERMACAAEPDEMTFNESMLKRVLGLLRKYDAHFSGGAAAADVQAAYAYTNLIKTALALVNRMNRWESVDPQAAVAVKRAVKTAGPLVLEIPDEVGHRTTIEDGAFFRGGANAQDALEPPGQNQL